MMNRVCPCYSNILVTVLSISGGGHRVRLCKVASLKSLSETVELPVT